MQPPKTVAQENAKKHAIKNAKKICNFWKSVFLQNMHSSRSCIYFDVFLHFLHFPRVFAFFRTFEALTGGPPKNAKNAQFHNLHVFRIFCIFVCFFFNCMFACFFFACLFACFLHFYFLVAFVFAFSDCFFFFLFCIFSSSGFPRISSSAYYISVLSCELQNFECKCVNDKRKIRMRKSSISINFI